jgi:hypothetical protein
MKQQIPLLSNTSMFISILNEVWNLQYPDIHIGPNFAPNVVAISARKTKVYKICELYKAIFSAFYNISQPNFAILLILVCSFRKYTFLPR